MGRKKAAELKTGSNHSDFVAKVDESLVGLGEPPQYLNDDGQSLWDFIDGLSREFGEFGVNDAQAIMIACKQYERLCVMWRELDRSIESGFPFQTHDGKIHPLLNPAASMEKNFMGSLDKLMLSPHGRKAMGAFQSSMREGLADSALIVEDDDGFNFDG